MTRIAAGIDGGGSGTRVVLLTEEGEPLGFGRSGPSNYNSVGRGTAAGHLREAFLRAWEAAGVKPRPADAAFFGMAGVISTAGGEIIRSMAAENRLALEEGIGVHHDIHIAWAGGLGGAPGIALIVGTGSSCYGCGGDGRSWRAGGWGHLLDDGGSGYFLGLRAMAAATRMADGRGPATVLFDTVLRFLGLADINDIMDAVHANGLTRARIAELGPEVLAAAGEGDLVANGILDEGANQLAEMVAAAAGKLFAGEDEIPVAATGGIVGGSPLYFERIGRAVTTAVPAARLQRPLLPPVLGAGLLALGHLGGVSGPALVNRLRSVKLPA